MNSVTVPDICMDLAQGFLGMGDWFGNVVESVGTLLIAAAAVYLAFIGWRAFKAAVNKV